MKLGENMLTLVRTMQKLNAEIAALLKTFEKLAGDMGYRNERGNAVTKDCSQSIDSPQHWAPPWFYRVLQGKRNSDDILILNIALDYPDKPDKVQEPIMLCARFQYKKETAKKHVGDWDSWDLWFCKPQKQINRVYSFKDLCLESEDFLKESKWSGDAAKAMQEVTFLAMPLAAITDSKVLEKDVLKRVLFRQKPVGKAFHGILDIGGRLHYNVAE